MSNQFKTPAIKPGDTFDRWTVLERAPNAPSAHARWLCKCACGRERAVFAKALRSGASRSCRCIQVGRRPDLKVTEQACTACGVVKPIEAFYPRMEGRYRLRICGPCQVARQKAAYWRDPERGRALGRVKTRDSRHRSPEPIRASNRKWAVANGERMELLRKAARAVRTAIRRGELVRPATCQECKETGVAIEAAHFDYSRPLDVRWLCRPCHRLWDKYEPKTLAREVA